MLFEISMAIIAIGFIALVIYLILTLIALRQTLKQSDQLIKSLNNLTQDLEVKAAAFDGIFDALSHTGEKLRQFTEKKNDEKAAPEVVYKETIPAVVNWIVGGVDLWFKLRK